MIALFIAALLGATSAARNAGVREKLPLNKPVSIEFTPTKTGEVRYACGMGMMGGVLLVE